MGGKSSSSSSSQSNSTTNNVDRRQVVDNGGIGLNSDMSTINISTLDSGAIQAGIDTAKKAIDAVSQADAINGEGFSQLLNLTENLFSAGGKILDTTAQTSMAAVNAVNTARNDAQGSIDQKTLVILAGAAVAAVFAFNRK